MSTAYSAPSGEAEPDAPVFSPYALYEGGRLLCVPEQILGVELELQDGPQFSETVMRAARRLQLRHHPDRPNGDAALSRHINVSAQWLTKHREEYAAWAATEEGAAQLARATLAGPAPLRSPLTPADERRVLAELDAGAAREELLRVERAGMQQEWGPVLAQLEAGAAREEDLLQERRRLVEEREAMRAELAAVAAREKRLLLERHQLERERQVLRQAQTAAREEAAAARRRLAAADSRRRQEGRLMSAVAGAAQAAELAAAKAAVRLRSRRPSPLLIAHLRQTAAGDNSSGVRRTARRLLEQLE